MRVVAFDSETYRFRPGLMAPPVVVGTFAERGPEGIESKILLRDDYLDYLEDLLDDPDVILVAANTAFDVVVSMAARERLIAKWFQAYSENRVFDVAIRQELLEIADGRVSVHSQNFVVRNGELVPAIYSLAALENLHLGVDRSIEKSDPDAWRTRYAELDGVPLEDWPKAAIDYALEDAIGALRVFEAQGGVENSPATEQIQNGASLALTLMSTWGVRTDPKTVEELEEFLLTERERVRRKLRWAGLLVRERMSPAEVRDNPERVAGEMEQVVIRPLTQAQKKKLEKGEVPEGVEVLTDEMISLAEKVPEGVFVDTYAQVIRRTVPYRWKMNLARMKEYVTRVYARKGMEPPRTDGGDVSTSKDTCYESGSRLLTLAADGGGVDKLIDTYLPVLKRGVEVPVNPQYRVLVNSGRTSARSWTDEDGTRYGFNIQNLPTGRRAGGEKVRESFVPRPGFLFSFSDYKTLELCALAQVCHVLFGFSTMRDAINEGKDLHVVLAAEILRSTYEEVMAERKKRNPDVEKARDAAKGGNFGLPGGLGVKTFIEYCRTNYDIKLTEQEARAIMDSWRRAWPEMKTYLDYISGLVGAGDATIKHPITGFVRGKVGYCDGANHLFQHLAATGAKIALFHVAWECYVDKGTALFGSRPIAFIHDEIGMEVPEQNGHAASMRLNEVMEWAMSQVIPDVTIKAEPTLMRRWYKQAEDVWCEEGHLVEWTPERRDKIPCECPESARSFKAA